MSYEDVMKVVLPQAGRQSPHITGHYGEQRAHGPHGGSDFNYEGGQSGINLTHPTVHSPVTGVITFVGGQYGTIKIRDTEGNSHELLHTQAQSVAVGQHVSVGDEVGSMGGRGPHGAGQYAQHVHYQMKDVHGHAINPEAYWNDRHAQVSTEHAPIAAQAHSSPTAAHGVRRHAHDQSTSELQRQLIRLGYTDAHGHPLSSHGHFDLATKHAVESFQSEHGLKIDGIAGSKTRHEIEAALAQQHVQAPTKTPLSLDDPAHTAHSLFKQNLQCVEQLNAERGIAPSLRDANIAGALTVDATARGLAQVDRVIPSEDGSRLFAVQNAGELLTEKFAAVETMKAIATPLEHSSSQWMQAAQKRPQELAHQQQRQVLAQVPSITMS